MKYVEIGSRGCLQVRSVGLMPFGGRVKRKLLYASDLHLSPRAVHVAKQLLEIVRHIKPDVVLLGGDLVDAQSGLPLLQKYIREILSVCPVWAIPGNHDVTVGVDRVCQSVESAGGRWLDASQRLECGENEIQIDGVLKHTDQSAFSILCAHEPAIFPEAIACGYDLVLAGHLHGSQCVLFQQNDLLYPGAWFFRWNGDYFREGNSVMVVSRGANDTLPIRWNCPREVILCTIS